MDSGSSLSAREHFLSILEAEISSEGNDAANETENSDGVAVAPGGEEDEVDKEQDE